MNYEEIENQENNLELIDDIPTSITNNDNVIGDMSVSESYGSTEQIIGTTSERIAIYDSVSDNMVRPDIDFISAPINEENQTMGEMPKATQANIETITVTYNNREYVIPAGYKYYCITANNTLEYVYLSNTPFYIHYYSNNNHICVINNSDVVYYALISNIEKLNILSLPKICSNENYSSDKTIKNIIGGNYYSCGQEIIKDPEEPEPQEPVDVSGGDFVTPESLQELYVSVETIGTAIQSINITATLIFMSILLIWTEKKIFGIVARFTKRGDKK